MGATLIKPGLSIPVSVVNGGTGLTSFGSALQYLRTNAAGNALEYATVSATYKGVVLSRSADLSVSANTATDVTWTRQIKTPSADVSHSTSSSPANITMNNATGTAVIRGILNWTSDAQYLSLKISILKNGSKVIEFVAYPYGGGTPINGPYPFQYVGDFVATDVFKVQVLAQTGTINGTVKGQISSVDSCICSVEVI